MKRIAFIFTFVLGLFAAGCQIEKDIDNPAYTNKDGKDGTMFVHFAAAKDAWVVMKDELDADNSKTFNVTVALTRAQQTDVVYNVSVVSTNGTENKEFSIPEKSVTVKAGEYLAQLPVKILYDGIEKDFTLKLELGLEVEETLINPAYGRKTAISVYSDNMTFDWKWLAGNWTVEDFNYYYGTTGSEYAVSISKGENDTEVWVKNLFESGSAIKGTVDFDAHTITFVGGQYGEHSDDYGCDLLYVAVDPDNDYDYYYDELDNPDYAHVFVAKMSPVGIVIDMYDYVMDGGDNNGYTFFGGIKSTLSR